MKSILAGTLLLALLLSLTSMTYALDFGNGVTASGDFYLRYDGDNLDSTTSTSYESDHRAVYWDLLLGLGISNGWTTNVKIMSRHSGSTTSEAVSDNTALLYFNGPFLGTNLTAGTFELITMNAGFVADQKLSGAQFVFGKRLQTKLTAGRLEAGVPEWDTNISSVDPAYRGIEFTLHLWEGAQFQAAYHDILYGEDDTIGELAFSTPLGRNLGLQIGYAQSNIVDVDDSNEAYNYKITFKAAQPEKAGSYDIYVGYYKLPVYAQFNSDYSNYADDYSQYWAWFVNKKSLTLGFDCVPAKNIIIQTFYSWQTAIDSYDGMQPDQKEKAYRTQLKFIF